MPLATVASNIHRRVSLEILISQVHQIPSFQASVHLASKATYGRYKTHPLLSIVWSSFRTWNLSGCPGHGNYEAICLTCCGGQQRPIDSRREAHYTGGRTPVSGVERTQVEIAGGS